jgi:integrase
MAVYDARDRFPEKSTVKPWVADYRDAAGKRHQPRFRTKKEAEAHYREQTLAVSSGTHVDISRAKAMTVDQLNKQFVTFKLSVSARGKPWAPATHAKHRAQYAKYVEPRWGHTPLASIRYVSVSDWINSLESDDGPAGASTKRQVAKMFSQLLGYAVRLNLLPANPAKLRDGSIDYMPRVEKRTDHVYLSMEQLAAFASKAGPYEDMILTAGLCGLRFGELAALRVGNLSLGSSPSMSVEASISDVPKDLGGRVEKTPKSGKARVVPLPTKLAKRLEVAVEGRRPDERVFTSPRGLTLRAENFRRDVFTPLVKAARADLKGFPVLTPHDLRHTAVSLHIRVGSNVKVVQRIAGHATAVLTLDTYAGLFDDDLHESAARLDANLPF